MIYQLIAFSFILVCCGAQEHLTCLRTDDVIAPSPPSTNDNVQQGRPGRRGAPGPIGLKGEPGIPDNSIIDSLKANLSAALVRGYMFMEDGWIAPFNGYQYKPSSSSQSWSQSRSLCQQRGGDLAQYGVRDVATRLTLFRGLSLHGHYWVGLSDSAREGTWTWLNGNEANDNDVALWRQGYPFSGLAQNDRDCATAYFWHGFDGLFIYDYVCSTNYRALCEKLA